MLCRQFQVYKALARLWSQPAKCTFRAYSTPAINESESVHFKAAVLHPNKQSLTIETMADRTKLEDGMVNTKCNMQFQFIECQCPIFSHFSCESASNIVAWIMPTFNAWPNWLMWRCHTSRAQSSVARYLKWAPIVRKTLSLETMLRSCPVIAPDFEVRKWPKISCDALLHRRN